jgi:hypothetical protein
VVLLHVPDVLDVPHVPPPKCDFLINLDRMYSLIAYFQDLSKYDLLVMVRVLDLTLKHVPLLIRKCSYQELYGQCYQTQKQSHLCPVHLL